MGGQFLLIGEFLFEYPVGLFRSLCLHNSDAIHDAVDMCIHSNIGRIIKNREYNFCGLYTHSGE